MRLKHVNVRVLLSSLLAVLALSAVVASAAQASVEGPFFKVAGTRLASGKSQELKVTGAGNTTFTYRGSTITCTTAQSAAGAKIVGTAAGVPEFSEQTITYTGCSDSASGCSISEIKTVPLTATVVFSSKRAGRIEVLYQATTKKASKLFASGTITGAQCALPGEVKYEGSVAGEVRDASTGELVEVGKEPAEAATLKVTLNPAIGTVFDEATEVGEIEMYANGGLEGRIWGTTMLESANKALWGVFT
jgi:hypothetical protein